MESMEAKVVALETRSTEVEKALNDLTKGSGGDLLVEKLRTLLRLMEEDRAECEAIRVQRDDLKEENQRLRTQLGKQTYRVQHLLRTIDEVEKGETK